MLSVKRCIGGMGVKLSLHFMVSILYVNRLLYRLLELIDAQNHGALLTPTPGPEDPRSLHLRSLHKPHPRHLPPMVPTLPSRRCLAHPRRGTQLSRRCSRPASLR